MLFQVTRLLEGLIAVATLVGAPAVVYLLLDDVLVVFLLLQ